MCMFIVCIYACKSVVCVVCVLLLCLYVYVFGCLWFVYGCGLCFKVVVDVNIHLYVCMIYVCVNMSVCIFVYLCTHACKFII